MKIFLRASLTDSETDANSAFTLMSISLTKIYLRKRLGPILNLEISNLLCPISKKTLHLVINFSSLLRLFVDDFGWSWKFKTCLSSQPIQNEGDLSKIVNEKQLQIQEVSHFAIKNRKFLMQGAITEDIHYINCQQIS